MLNPSFSYFYVIPLFNLGGCMKNRVFNTMIYNKKRYIINHNINFYLH